MSITERIMFFFGYTKVPESAVRLTEDVLYFLNRIDMPEEDEENRSRLEHAKRGVKTLADYFRSCRLSIKEEKR